MRSSCPSRLFSALDMAFDKFRRVPVDDEMKDILYNLALDYERKRQFNKEAAVYEYIESHDAITAARSG